jgi:hypothetical protein
MTDAITELRKRLNALDCSQESIQKTSVEFINYVKNDSTVVEDLVKLWKFFTTNKTNKLAYLYLSNDVIQNSFFQKLNIHEVFFDHLTQVFPSLCNSLNDKLKKEILRMIEIWNERQIYETSKLESLKQLLCVSTQINSDNLENPLFQIYLKNNNITISDKIKEMANNLESLERYNERLLKIKEDQKDTINNENTNSNGNKNSHKKEIEKLTQIQNKTREAILRSTSEVVKKQNQVYFKHIFYLQEVDKMLEKINAFKKIHGKTDTATVSENYNINVNVINTSSQSENMILD